MKITRPAQTVEVCDICRVSSRFLQTCDVCGNQFCLSCEGTVAASWGFTRICRDCAKADVVRAVCAKFAKRLTPIYRAREKALRKLQPRRSFTET